MGKCLQEVNMPKAPVLIGGFLMSSDTKLARLAGFASLDSNPQLDEHLLEAINKNG